MRNFGRRWPTRTISEVRKFCATSRQGHVGGDERDREPSAGKQHGEISHVAARGEELRLAGKLESDFVHVGLVNRAGHDGIDFARRVSRTASSRATKAACALARSRFA